MNLDDDLDDKERSLITSFKRHLNTIMGMEKGDPSKYQLYKALSLTIWDELVKDLFLYIILYRNIFFHILYSYYIEKDYLYMIYIYMIYYTLVIIYLYSLYINMIYSFSILV